MWLPRPSYRLLLLLALAALPAALALGTRWLWMAVALFDVGLVVVYMVDARLWSKRRQVEVTRELPERVARNRPFAVKLTAHSRWPGEVALAIDDRLPSSFEPTAHSHHLRIGPGQTAELTTSVVAKQRGTFALRPPVVEATVRSRLGIFRVAPASGKQTISVIPDTQAIDRFERLVRLQRLHEMGISRIRATGEGTEVAGLRPYTAGDPYGRIDWKATARRAALVSRQMHTERRQNVVMLLDCGRRMAREAEGRSRLDHAVEAALLLAHVALRADDRVGLLAFSDRTLAAVPPVRGRQGIHLLADAMHGLEPSLREPPYGKMAAEVRRFFPKRSLLFLFTDVIEPASLEALAVPVRFLSRHDLVMCVVFNDEAIAAARQEAIVDAASVFHSGAAAELGMEREQGLSALRRAGALVLEATAPRLPTQVINRYFEIKARRML